MLPDLSALLREWDSVLKVLGALAAPGGLWFWIDKYRNRIRVKVRHAGFATQGTDGRGLMLLVENIGSTATSTGPLLLISGRSEKREPFTLKYSLERAHAKLMPFDLVELISSHNDRESRTLFWAWYFVVKLPLSRGGTVKVRCRNSKFEQLGFWRFHWELFRFALLRQTPGPD